MLTFKINAFDKKQNKFVMLTFVFCGLYWECALPYCTVYAYSLLELFADLQYIHNLKVNGYNLIYN